MINVTKTYLPQKEKYMAYIDKIYESGWLTNNGNLLQELESKLLKYLGVQNLLIVANGTLALQVAYRALNIPHGEVITTPFSFVATTSSLVWEGYKPVFADIDKDSFNLDPSNIERLITKSTVGILPVHVFGNSCEINNIQEIATKTGLKVVYDAAHAFGVKYKNKSILCYGDASILSFHSTKIFHTIEGGAIIFKKKEDLETAKLMINFGIPGYDMVSSLGINCKMNEFQAAMGLCILDEIENIFELRKQKWLNYFHSLLDFNGIVLQKQNPDSNNNYSYFPIVFENEKVMMRVKRSLNKINIWPRRYFYPSLEKMPYLNQMQNQILEHSQKISSCILCLPLYHDLSPQIQDRIVKKIKSNI